MLLSGSRPTCNAQIDWVNFIQLGSTQYVAGPESPSVLLESDLGPVYAHVKFKVSGNVCDPSYRAVGGTIQQRHVGRRGHGTRFRTGLPRGLVVRFKSVVKGNVRLFINRWS
jgi:hypothetical protein